MQIIAIANQKGGSGKTATAAALVQAAALDGKKVLAVDLDPQGNLSFALAADMSGKTTYDLLEGTPARRTIQTVRGVDIIPASWDNATAKTAPGSALRLQKALEPIRFKYDLIIVDTPPTMGELQLNALQAATGLIIPLQAEMFGLKGLYQIADTAEHIKHSNPALEYKGIVFTRYNGRSTIAKQMQTAIIQTAEELGIPLLGTIREGVAIREAEAMQVNLFEYAPRSNPALDYIELYRKIMEE